MKRIRENWLVSVLLPTLVIPLALLFAKYYFIDLPARSPNLEYKISHGIHSQTDDLRECFTYIHIENTGRGESLDDRAYILVKFYGMILRLSEPWHLPIGSYFVDENNKSIKSCNRRSVCKLVLGNLVSDGRASFGFISNNTLIDLPYISYAGLLIKPSRCQGIRKELLPSCEAGN